MFVTAQQEIPKMSITIDLPAEGPGITVITAHGLERVVHTFHELHAMLVEQRRPKVAGIGSEEAKLILAEWERIGPEGAGKIHRQALRRLPDENRFNFHDHAIKAYDSRGRRVPSSTDPVPDLV